MGDGYMTEPAHALLATPPHYRGRFAPSPSGPLHFGSLIAALGSYLQARAEGGDWLVRIEDLDQERTRPNAASAILRTLEAFGLAWDGAVRYQSTSLESYRSAVADLLARDWAYPCTCSRRQVAAGGTLGLEGPLYPGTCRRRGARALAGASLRLRTDPGEVSVRDAIQGWLRQRLAQAIGDFVIQRADGVYAYQLAVVVDDAEQGITEVVRGADLWVSTPRQIYLQRLLGLPTPHYAHLPVAVDAQGRKLSKSDAAAPLDPADPLPALMGAWQFLGQELAPEWPGNLQAFWAWARARWDLRRVPPRPTRPIAEVSAPMQAAAASAAMRS